METFVKIIICKTLAKHETNQHQNTDYSGYYNFPQKKQHILLQYINLCSVQMFLLAWLLCPQFESVSPTCQQMSLVHLGQQLLEAVRSGQDDDVKALMANGAPFTTDWVRFICVNYGIIFRLIRNAWVWTRICWQETESRS